MLFSLVKPNVQEYSNVLIYIPIKTQTSHQRVPLSFLILLSFLSCPPFFVQNLKFVSVTHQVVNATQTIGNDFFHHPLD